MRVLCTLPNCSEENSGRTFKATPGGMLSEDLFEHDAARLLSIPGYQEWKETAPSSDSNKPDGEQTGETAASGAALADAQTGKADGHDGDGKDEKTVKSEKHVKAAKGKTPDKKDHVTRPQPRE